MPWINAERLTKTSARLGKVPLFFERVTQVGVRRHIPGSKPQRLPKERAGVCELPLLLEDDAQANQRLDKLWIELQCPLVARGSLLPLPSVFENVSQVAIGVGILRIQA